ncbi:MULTISPECIES: serine/threonine-protein kinase [Streptomyces]|uniref:serine/threonine-protein kinase n=1 Tax=Streptomyces TaxID=1883 RepID=UPI0001853160|nr:MULTISPECIES: serine/threonine-protein kinase [Streptomyces]MYT03319.1 protein kinase [Streptomyces sp. SID5470]
MKARRSAFPAALSATAEVVADRYRLGARLGSGGAADVYRGVDLRLKRPVAVKVFRLDAEPALEERFADEAVLLAGLQHPGLVTLYDAGRHENRPFLVMELVNGPTLAQGIAAGAMEPPRVARLGTALAGALAHVHEAGIVHRDVKPSNILLDTAGVPHLADFGISRMIGATRHTASGALLGTAAYLAPEQVLGKVVGPSADIYALGLVLLECLKGELEYGGTPLEAAVARLHRPPVLPGTVPPRLAELIHAMTALDDNVRPDARQCAEVLSALAAEAPVPTAANAVGPDGPDGGRAGARTEGCPAPTAAGPRLRQQAVRPLRTRRPLLVTGAAVLTALLGATLAVSLDGAGNGDDRSAPGSLGSTPLEQPSPTTSAESPRRAAGQPAASTSAPPSKAPRHATSAASDPRARTPSSDPTSGHGPGTSADHKDTQNSRPRPGAARANDKNPPEKSAKSKGGLAGKEHG